jgi:hypothetical protein
MNAPVCRIPKAIFPAAAVLSLVLASAANRSEGQSNAAASSTATISAAAAGSLARVALIGASVTSGYASTRLPGNASGELLRLEHYMDAAIVTSHDPVRHFSSSLFFASAEKSGQSQIDSLLQMKPTLVVGVDFLFWFCYGEGLSEPQRLERFDRGLKMIEAVPCPLIIGDIPTYTPGFSDLLSPREIPLSGTIEEANRRLQSWASDHPQVSVVKLSNLLRAIADGQGFAVHGHAISADQVRQLLQPDHLHLLPSGCAVLTVAILDSFHASDLAGKVQWDPGEIERQTVAAIAKAWPEVTTSGTVFDPSHAPVSGVRLEALSTAVAQSRAVVSDHSGHYSMVWRPRPMVENQRRTSLLLARDTARNWAVLVGLSLTNTNVDVLLQPGLVLSGKVQDSAGQALKGAMLQVFFVFDEPIALLPRLTISNQDQGAFGFSALPQGWAYEIHATARGYGQSTVQVPADKTQTGLLELPPIKLKSAISR